MSDASVHVPEVLGDANHLMEHLKQEARGRSVKLLLTGSAGCGKSTLLNALVSVLAGYYCHVQLAGAGCGDCGYLTDAPRLVPLLQYALGEAADFEVSVWDQTNHRSEQELAVVASGRVRSGERLPNAIDMARMAELLHRPVSARDAVDCGVVLVPALTLVTEPCPPRYIVDAMNSARSYTANTGDVQVLPLILVITKLDDWSEMNGHDPSTVLANGELIAPLLRKAADWGFPGSMVLPMGYLDFGTVDYADPQDPCVLALKRLLVLATRTASLFQKKLERSGAGCGKFKDVWEGISSNDKDCLTDGNAGRGGKWN